jgi:hypothetical protein
LLETLKSELSDCTATTSNVGKRSSLRMELKLSREVNMTSAVITSRVLVLSILRRIQYVKPVCGSFLVLSQHDAPDPRLIRTTWV